MRRGQGTRTGQRTRFLARQRLHDEAMLEPIAGDTAAHAGVPPPQARPGDTVTTPSTSYPTNPSRRTCAGGHAAPDEASYPDSRARDSHARGRCSGPAYRERSPSTWPRSKARPSTIGRPTWCSSPNRQRRAAPTPSEPTGAALPNQLVPPAVPARRRRPPPHEPSRSETQSRHMVGATADSAVFWAAGDGVALLVGDDAETWDVSVRVSFAAVDEIVRLLDAGLS